MAFLEGYAPAEDSEKDWQHITTDSDAGSDYSTLTEGSASSDNILSLENQSQLADIAKKTQAELEKRNKKRKLKDRKGKDKADKRPMKKKRGRMSKKKYLNKRRENSGVIFLGDVPHGFYEKEMKRFFSQFGKVDRIRVARNKRGKSRHFAFVEFLDKEA